MIKIEEIKDPSFIKGLNKKELGQLATDIRKFLVDNISKTGGHLASNLGVVELTLGLFYVFDYEKDKFLYDVGHQSYVHKILTGRAKDFSTLRSFNGMSGYVNRSESKYDVWESGHSSTSISAAAGMMIAGKNEIDFGRPIVVIGDSSISNGVAFEGLNFLGNQKKGNPIIIINDNKMGISKSVGSMTRIFGRMRRTKLWRIIKRSLTAISPKCVTNWFHQVKRGVKGYIQSDNIFEDMGFDYYGPIDGNNIREVIRTFERVKSCNEPVIVHLITKKGAGYQYAEDDELGSFHGVAPFDIQTGKPLTEPNPNMHTYSKIMASALINHHKKEEFYCITPAMKAGAELELFASLYPTYFFDVGISEEHAAVMAAGMALQNKKVVLLMYSTFAQRAYDQFVNDIGRQNLNVIIGIDRAGVVGEDGSTHQGIYDVAMFNSMPNYTICMGKDGKETVGLLKYAFKNNGPIVIRYPRRKDRMDLYDLSNEIDSLSWEVLKSGSKAYVISYGPILNRIAEAIEKNDLDVTLINARFIRPIDEILTKEIIDSNLPIVIIEECVNIGTLNTNIINFANKHNKYPKLISYGINPNTIIPHGKIDVILDHFGFSIDDITKVIKNSYEN